MNPLVDDVTSGWHFALVSTAAAALAVFALRRIPASRRGPWRYFVAGLVLTVVGDLVWSWMDRSGDVPFPGPPDLPYLLGMATMVWGAISLLRGRGWRQAGRTAIDAAIVAVCGALLLWLTVGSGLLAHADDGRLAFLVGLAYPLLDIVLVGALAALAFGPGLRARTDGLLSVTFVLLLVADVAYLVVETTSVYVDGGPLDSLWLLAYACLAAAVRRASTHPAPPSDRDGTLTLTRAQLLGLGLPLVAVGIAVTVVGYRRLTSDPEAFVSDLLVTAPLGVVVVALLLTRVALTARALATTIRQRDASYRRELALATVASSLALADDLAAVREAVHEASAVVDQPDATVTLELPRAGATKIAESGSGRSTLRVPLTPEPSDGSLVVVSERALPPTVRGPLERIASDVVMALDRCRLVEELRASEQRFGSLVRNAPDAITVHDAGGRLTYVSPALGRITGSPAEGLVGERWDAQFHPDDLPQVRAAQEQALSTPRGTAVVEARIRNQTDGWRWVEARVTNLLDDPTVAGVVINQRDTTERQRLQRQLQHQAEHDALTGLANRRRFGDAVRSRAGRGPDAVLFLDLDRFKPVNDEHGHALGDRLLAVIADRLRAVLRDDDLAARLGGDEFAVLLPDTDVAVAATIGERVRDAIRTPVRLGDVTVQVDASVGVAASSAGEPDRDLLQDADVAMYAAKQAGRSRVEVFSPAVHTSTEARHELDEDLRWAVERGQLVLAYRPVHRLDSDRIIGADAIVRWCHPRRGFVPEAEMRAAARRIGADAAITRWAIREACWEARAWAERPDGFTVAVSVDPSELDVDGFADDVEGVLSATGSFPHTLVIEVGGAAISSPTPRAAGAIAQLRAAGVRLRLADLGTGETPVQRLRNAPVDELRVASELTRTIGAPRCEDSALVRAVLQLADAFDLHSVAAGVEDAAQRVALRARGCTSGSGPLWGEVRSAEELSTLLETTDADDHVAPSAPRSRSAGGLADGR